MKKFAVFIISVCLTLCIVGCTSTNEKEKIVSENEATTSFTEITKPENSYVHTENEPTENSTLSAETTSFTTSENVAEKVSKEPIISATATTKSDSLDNNQTQNKTVANENSATESTSIIVPETTTKVQEEQKFDVSYWLAYAQNYAQSIGLTLDETATECWDNPISANANSKNIGADIENRLNRYKSIEGFTAVWIWAKKVSDTQYEIYIGYA